MLTDKQDELLNLLKRSREFESIPKDLQPLVEDLVRTKDIRVTARGLFVSTRGKCTTCTGKGYRPSKRLKRNVICHCEKGDQYR